MSKNQGTAMRDPALLDRLMRGRFSNRSLASRVGCSYQMIGHLRTGAKRSCSLELGRRIAAALGVGFEVLFSAETPRDDGNPPVERPEEAVI